MSAFVSQETPEQQRLHGADVPSGVISRRRRMHSAERGDVTRHCGNVTALHMITVVTWRDTVLLASHVTAGT